ncbi:MAG: hypothetical protein HYZ23_06250 [Chloroflexi bacterium]|nr:hypothetical protein [Chloroflexota bacterium]
MSRKKKIWAAIAALILLLPMRVTCGNMFYGCATAPDTDGYYYTYYEVEPLGITLVESLIQTNLRVYYWRGKDAHFIGKP